MLVANFVTGSIPGLAHVVTLIVAGLLVIAVNFLPHFVAKYGVLTKSLLSKVGQDGKAVIMGVISCFAYDAIKALGSLST